MDSLLQTALRATSRAKRCVPRTVARQRGVPSPSPRGALLAAMRAKNVSLPRRAVRAPSTSAAAAAAAPPPHLIAADVQASMDHAVHERSQHSLPAPLQFRADMMSVAIRDLSRRNQLDAARALFTMELEAVTSSSGGAAVAAPHLRNPLSRLVEGYGRSSDPLAGLVVVEAVMADEHVDGVCDESTFIALLHALVRGRRGLNSGSVGPESGGEGTSGSSPPSLGVTHALARVSDAMAAAGLTPSLRCRNAFLLLAVKGVEAAERTAPPQLSFDPDAILRRIVAAEVDAMWQSGTTPNEQTFATLFRGATQSRSRKAVRLALDHVHRCDCEHVLEHPAVVYEIVRAQLRTGNGDGHAAAAALRSLEQWRARNPHREASLPLMLSMLLNELSMLACARVAGSAVVPHSGATSHGGNNASTPQSLWFAELGEGGTRGGGFGSSSSTLGASPRSMAESRENLRAAVGVWREIETSALSASPTSTAAFLRALAHHRRWDLLHQCRVTNPSTRRVVPALLHCFAKIGPRARTAVKRLHSVIRKRGGFGDAPVPHRTASALANAMVACIGVHAATSTARAWTLARQRSLGEQHSPSATDERAFCAILDAVSSRADLRDAFRVIETMVTSGVMPGAATRRALTEMVGRIGTGRPVHTSLGAEVRGAALYTHAISCSFFDSSSLPYLAHTHLLFLSLSSRCAHGRHGADWSRACRALVRRGRRRRDGQRRPRGRDENAAARYAVPPHLRAGC